jgi:alpha-tubulin suppressor-like RCC1 family protein
MFALKKFWSRAALSAAAVAALAAGGAAPARAESTSLAVASGYSHTCGVKKDHSLWCWGANDSGQLGDGTTTNRTLPVQVTALGTSVAEVSVGDLYTCARKTDGTLWCWGNNASGQLGNSTAVDTSTPTQVTALGTGVAEISAGDLFACARKTDGSVWCWGSGPLGDGTGTPALAPVQVPGLSGVAQISTGDGAACARKTDGSLWCWGFNTFGIVGDGTTNDQLSPVQVTTLGSSVSCVSVGDLFACATKSDGTVWCWGTNDKGELGDGTTTNHYAPAAVSGLPGQASSVVANGRHACSVLTDGRLFCWGWNGAGEIGDGTTVDRHAPTQVTTLGSGLGQASAGVNQDTCATLTDGSLWCWGSDSSAQIGDGAGVTRKTPVQVLAAIASANVPATPVWARAGLALLLVLVAWLGRRRLNGKMLLATVLALGVASAAGCTDTRGPAGAASAPTAAAPSTTEEITGSIQIALQVPPSVQINAATYQVTRGTFTQAGSIDVSHSSTINGIIGGLPAGTGYQLTLSMADPTHKLTGCTGSAPFDVVAGMVTPVAIDVTCHVAGPPPPPPPPMVPIPYSAVVLLACALLGAGLGGAGRSRRQGRER